MRMFNLKVLVLLSLGHLSTDIYQGALPAILPFLKAKLSLSYSMAGLIMLAANFTSSVIQPFFGFISDRGEKPLFLPLGCIVAGIGISLLSLPSNYITVLALVVVSGLGIASYHPEGFKTAYYFTGQKAATGMSVFSVGGNLGFALGPVFSIYLVKNFGLSSLPAMIIPSLFFLTAVFFFWNTLTIPKMERGPKREEKHAIPKGATVSLVLLVLTVIMRSWTHAGLTTYIPFYYIDYLKGDPIYAGKLVSVFLLGGVAGTLLGSPIADRWGHKRYLVFSLGCTSLLLPLIFSVKGYLLFLVLGTIGMVLISSFTVTIVMAQKLLPGNLGIASGLMVGFAIGTGGVGVTILGVLADRYGVPAALKSITFLPFIGLAISSLFKYPAAKQAGS